MYIINIKQGGRGKEGGGGRETSTPKSVLSLCVLWIWPRRPERISLNLLLAAAAAASSLDATRFPRLPNGN